MKDRLITSILMLTLSLTLNVGYCQNIKAGTAKNYENKETTDTSATFKAFNLGEYNKFIKLAEAELGGSKNKIELLIGLSQAYNTKRNFEKGLFYSNEALKIQPKNYKALFSKANCFLFLEKIDSAEYYYKKVLQLNPYYARANLNLAKVYLIKRDNVNSINQYLKAIALFHKNNFRDEVEFYCNLVLEIDPNNKPAKQYLQLNNR